jgi:tungstate transport system ATP-binding protein
VLDVGRLEVASGEVLAVLGPSGSGKSVLLRMLNLLERPSEGTVRFYGDDVTGLEGRERTAVSRRMAMVFQDPLLFRGTVAGNVAYGLKVRKVPPEERAGRVTEMLDVVGLGNRSGAYVNSLSGGEAQRVSVARALVIKPEVLLLDEPFANLDAPTRRALQEETRDILRQRNMTAVFVTHDQDEASRMGDRILVLHDGSIAQEGGAREIFYRPATEFVARFVGMDNVYEGLVEASEEGVARISVDGRRVYAVTDARAGENVKVGIRPEDVTLVPAGEVDTPSSSRNSFAGKVTGVESRGPVARVTVACPFPLVALITARSLDELEISEGAEIGVRFKATAVVVFGDGGG